MYLTSPDYPMVHWLPSRKYGYFKGYVRAWVQFGLPDTDMFEFLFLLTREEWLNVFGDELTLGVGIWFMGSVRIVICDFIFLAGGPEDFHFALRVKGTKELEEIFS